MSDINALEKRLNYSFQRKQILKEALTHPSFANEQKGSVNHNQRLEFLGDAVLELIVSEYLYQTFDHPEGVLTKIRAAVVSEPTLAECAARLGLAQVLLLGKGEDLSGGRQRPSILADAFEAVVGALYLDGGLAAARAFVIKELKESIHQAEKAGGGDWDYKTMLQELWQRDGSANIEYRLVKETGPAHAKTFFSEVWIGGKPMGAGRGRTKKEAEQNAAREALALSSICEIRSSDR